MCEMMNVNANHIASILRAISAKLDQASDELCRLDGQIGDGDHGTTMALGFDAVAQGLFDEDLGKLAIDELLTLSADRFLDAVGATTGPLYASAFLSASAFAKGKTLLSIKEAPLLLVAMFEGIAARGKAQPGDKTMIDVWFPVSQYIRTEYQPGSDLKQMTSDIRKIAAEGVAMTKAMVASKGRAARLGERSIGHADPGATSAAIIINCFCDFFYECSL